MAVELAFGESVVHVGSEFPDMGIVSPLTIGDTATVLQINTDDASALWARAPRLAPSLDTSSPTRSGASATANWSTPSDIAGTSLSGSATSLTTRSSQPPRRPSAPAERPTDTYSAAAPFPQAAAVELTTRPVPLDGRFSRKAAPSRVPVGSSLASVAVGAARGAFRRLRSLASIERGMDDLWLTGSPHLASDSTH